MRQPCGASGKVHAHGHTVHGGYGDGAAVALDHAHAHRGGGIVHTRPRRRGIAVVRIGHTGKVGLYRCFKKSDGQNRAQVTLLVFENNPATVHTGNVTVVQCQPVGVFRTALGLVIHIQPRRFLRHLLQAVGAGKPHPDHAAGDAVQGGGGIHRVVRVRVAALPVGGLVRLLLRYRLGDGQGVHVDDALIARQRVEHAHRAARIETCRVGFGQREGIAVDRTAHAGDHGTVCLQPVILFGRHTSGIGFRHLQGGGGAYSGGELTARSQGHADGVDFARIVITVLRVVLETVGDADGDLPRLVVRLIVVHAALVVPVRHGQGEVQVVVVSAGDAHRVPVVVVDFKQAARAVGVQAPEGDPVAHFLAFGPVYPVEAF